jgi:hypothetical protein
MNQGPDELSTAARALLRDYGRTIAPRHDGGAVLRAVQARVGATTIAAAPATSRWRRLTLVAGVGAVAFTLLAAWPMLGDRAPAEQVAAIDDPVPAVPRTEATLPIDAETRSDPPVPVDGSSIDLGASENHAQRLDAPPPDPMRRAVRSPSPVRPRSRRNTTPPASDLAAEVAVLERARTALARGDVTAAEEAVAEHRRQFAHGRLVAERDATAVMIACAADRDGAREAARRHLMRADAAPYRARIEATCDR